MRITTYNKDAAIEYLMALSLDLLMSDEVATLDGEKATNLFRVVGAMDASKIASAISAFEATQ